MKAIILVITGLIMLFLTTKKEKEKSYVRRIENTRSIVSSQIQYINDEFKQLSYESHEKIAPIYNIFKQLSKDYSQIIYWSKRLDSLPIDTLVSIQNRMKNSISIHDTLRYNSLWDKIKNLESDIQQISKTKNNTIYLNALINNFLYTIYDISNYLISKTESSGGGWKHVVIYQHTYNKTVKQNEVYRSSIFIATENMIDLPIYVDGNYIKDITYIDNVFKKRIQTKDSIKIILGVLKAKNPSTGSIVEYPFCDTVWVSH